MTKASAGEPALRTVERPARRPGKEVILRAAIEAMGELGYEGASTRDMAARAGVSVAALYHHFPSKLDLLRDFLAEAYDVIISRLLRRMAAADPSPPAQLDEFVATIIASYLHNDFARLAANVASKEYTRLQPPDRASIDKKRRRVLRILTGVLEEGVQSGDFDVAEPKEAARAIVALALAPLGSFTEMRKSMGSVIRLYQGFARGIARSG